DQAVIADRTGMLGAGPNHGVFHDDPVAPDPDGAAGLAHEAHAVQNTHVRSNRDVAAQRRIGCHPGRRIDRWTLSRVLNQHRLAMLSPRRMGGQVAIQATPAVVSYPRRSLWAIHAQFSVATCSAIVSGDPSLRTGRVQCSPASSSGQRAQVSPQTVGAGTDALVQIQMLRPVNRNTPGRPPTLIFNPNNNF